LASCFVQLQRTPCSFAASISTSRSITHKEAQHRRNPGLGAAHGESAQSNRAARRAASDLRERWQHGEKAVVRERRAVAEAARAAGNMRGIPPAHVKHRWFSLHAIAVFQRLLLACAANGRLALLSAAS
jgi:hypothetical protein